MRVFVAVDINEALRAQIVRVREAIQRIVGEARVPPRITWAKEEVAHVTVRFIGETAEDRLPDIQHALAAVRIAPVDAKWDTLGTFGSQRRPRVIWIAPTSGSEVFTLVAQQVNTALDPIIGPGDTRPYQPHLTVARVRDEGRGVDWERALATVEIVPTLSRVDHVTLYRSRLSPKGPTYTALSTHG